MNARDRLLLEASAVVRDHASPAARACASREAKEIDTAELSRAQQHEVHALFAIRSTMMALGSAPAESRCHLAVALDALVRAARARPMETGVRIGARAETTGLYWMNER